MKNKADKLSDFSKSLKRGRSGAGQLPDSCAQQGKDGIQFFSF